MHSGRQRVRKVTVACLMALLFTAGPGVDATASEDQVSGVEVLLTGGSLKSGRANVEAQITNKAQRQLLGLRIAAYYDPLDALPAPDAQWRLHEFVLEPGLAPGASAMLSFTDNNAAQYVLLRCVLARFSLAISVDGAAELAAQYELLEQDGQRYVAARDLADALGARLRQATDKRVILDLPDLPAALVYLPGSQELQLSGVRQQLSWPVLQLAGRSWLPLEESCLLLGFSAEYDYNANILRLARRAETAPPSPDG